MHSSTPRRPNRRLVFVGVSAVTLALLAGCGSSEDGKETTKGELAALSKLPKFIQDDFKAGDKNGDGRIQDTELTAMIEEDFTASDVDKDGEITEADVQKELGKDADATASLKGMDIDGDGRIPLEEYTQHVERDFMKQMDTNKDGHLDPPEVAKFYEGQRKNGDDK